MISDTDVNILYCISTCQIGLVVSRTYFVTSLSSCTSVIRRHIADWRLLRHKSVCTVIHVCSGSRLLLIICLAKHSKSLKTRTNHKYTPKQKPPNRPTMPTPLPYSQAEYEAVLHGGIFKSVDTVQAWERKIVQQMPFDSAESTMMIIIGVNALKRFVPFCSGNQSLVYPSMQPDDIRQLLDRRRHRPAHQEEEPRAHQIHRRLPGARRQVAEGLFLFGDCGNVRN
jgi:hypothetical protein